MGAEVASAITNGIVLGCTYGLIGVGFVIVFRATQVISFAQGAFMMLGAMLFTTFVNHGFGLTLSILCAVPALLIVGALVYYVVFARFSGAEPFVLSLSTIGLGILMEAVVILIYGPSAIPIPSEFSPANHTIVGALKINDLEIFTICATVVLFAVIMLGLRLTPIGLRMRAVADDSNLAGYAGLNVPLLSGLAWALAAVAACVAGIVFLLGSEPDPVSVYDLGLLAFPAIILGGFDSIGGCLVGGLIIAFVQTSVVTWWGGNYQDVTSYVILLVLLLLRPQGLFGKVDARRL